MTDEINADELRAPDTSVLLSHATEPAQGLASADWQVRSVPSVPWHPTVHAMTSTTGRPSTPISA